MTDVCQITYNILALSLLYIHHQDDGEWLMNINEFYNEIRDRNSDRILIQSSNRLINIWRISRYYMMIIFQISIMANYAIKFKLIYIYPVSFILSYFHSTFVNVVTFIIISRTTFICLFLSFKYIILFAKLNKQFSELNIPEDSQLLVNLLIIHNKLSDSVLEMNRFLKPIYIIVTGLFSPIICYLTFMFLYSDFDYFVSLACLFIIVNFSILNLTLSSLIALIDIECDRSLHLIHGFALKIKDSQQIFQVLINPKLFYNLFSFLRSECI